MHTGSRLADGRAPFRTWRRRAGGTGSSPGARTKLEVSIATPRLRAREAGWRKAEGEGSGHWNVQTRGLTGCQECHTSPAEACPHPRPARNGRLQLSFRAARWAPTRSHLFREDPLPGGPALQGWGLLRSACDKWVQIVRTQSTTVRKRSPRCHGEGKGATTEADIQPCKERSLCVTRTARGPATSLGPPPKQPSLALHLFAARRRVIGRLRASRWSAV